MVKLAVVAPGDPLDVSIWSGTPYYATRALQTRYPNLLSVKQPRPAWFEPARRAVRRLTRGYIDPAWSETLGRRHALLLARQLRHAGVDAVVCIGISPLSAYLAEMLPVIHVSDATSALMRTYYQEFVGLHPSLADGAQRLDMASVRRAKACLLASPWAAQSAIDDYGADPARVHVVPLGANVDGVDPMARRSENDDGVCHLVFIGVDWHRKRGDLAVQAATELARRGVRVKLDIVGAMPPAPIDPELATVHGFISKATPEGTRLFHSLMTRADFLLVPTARECFGVFAAEGNAFGVPVISTRTGGLPGVIVDGLNGYLLPPEAGPQAYADTIAAIWSDKVEYEKLREGAAARFRTVLNWDAWVTRAGEIIDHVIDEAATH
jgi:glycosyltransferase involved in cell wall biosynthesis